MENSETLVEELEIINKQSYAMALSIHKDPALRRQSAEQAKLLIKRLNHIAEELERIDPQSHKQWFHRISESFLDLYFVMRDSDTTSLRLGDIIKWG